LDTVNIFKKLLDRLLHRTDVSVMMYAIASVAAAFYCLPVCSGHAAADWANRTIYQVLTDRFAASNSESWAACSDLSKYCGGTWAGIEGQLDYIAGMGFDAIWISPMPENLGDDYHGYAFLDLYQPNSHFGDEAALRSLVAAAHARSPPVWIMLDVVGNHVAPVDEAYDLVTPFNISSYYHYPICQIKDWGNQEEVENCRLSNLPDLDQSNSYVRSTLLDWVASLQAQYGFDGLRVDTVCEVSADFWAEWNAAAGMYCVGEVFNGDIDYVAPYQLYMDGMLSYPLYFAMIDVFSSQKSMSEFESLIGPSGSYFSKFKNVDYLGTFVDNHDNARFLYTQSSVVLYKNALVMTLFNFGIPIIYYGSEQGYSGGDDPQNRESLWPNYDTSSDLYEFISLLVSTRKAEEVWADSQTQRYASQDFYSFSRGNTLICLTNTGGTEVTVTLAYLPAAYVTGATVCNVLSTAKTDCAVISGGKLTVTMTGGLPKVYVLA
jgi:alpha-amylase